MTVPRPLAVMAEQCTGRGAHGVVNAAAPLAAQAGADMLRRGGNAYDAVVAMALAEGVVLPPKCGLAGDLIAIVLPAGASEPEALIAVGGAPSGLADIALAGSWSDVGPTSVGPPGAPAGLLALSARGDLSLAVQAAPALELTEGFPWADVCTDLSRQAADLVQQQNPDGCAYYPDGVPIAAGTIVRLPRLAAAIESFVALREGFLHGPVGAAIVDAVQARGGVLTLADVASAVAEWLPCAEGNAGPLRAWATPAPTHGPSLLDAVAGAARGDTPAIEYRRVMDAIAARAATLGDPSGTSMISAVDRRGNVVVVVHSNSYPRFGSGIVEPEYSLVLANRAGRGFTPEPGHPNFPVAGRRPATTLHAWAVADETGAVRFLGATPGGANQMPWNAQTIGQIVSGVDHPGLLVTSPRWEWLPDDDGVRVEDGFAADAVEALEAATPRLVRSPRWACRSAQQVVRVPRPGEAVVGAADPRTVGLSLGT